MWFYGQRLLHDGGDRQSKVIEMGSCPAYLRSSIVICVARPEGLIRARHGGLRIGGRKMVLARETQIMKGLVVL